MPIRTRTGRWRARGWKKLKAGKIGRPSLGTFRTKREAIEVEEKEKRRLRGGLDTDVTVDKMITRFLAEADIKRSVWPRIKSALRNACVDIADRPFVDVTDREWLKLADTRISWGTQLKRFLKWAHSKRELDHNPLDGWSRPRRGVGRKRLKLPTAEQFRELLRACYEIHGVYGGELVALILVSAATGLRMAEVCALRCSDIDLANHQVLVERQRTSDGTVDTPKSDEERLITFPPEAVEALARIQGRDVLAMIAEDSDDDVFATMRGRPLRPCHLYFYMKPVRARLDFKLCGWHDLRHLSGTRMAEAGIDARDIAQQLGHQDGGRLALALYIHREEDVSHARRMERMYGMAPLARPAAVKPGDQEAA